VGSCNILHGNVGGTFTIQQTDGALVLVEPVGAPGLGGVDMNGHFRIGFAMEDPNNIGYTLIDGYFALSNGAPVSMSGTEELTGNTGVLDCDLRTKFIASHVP